MPEEVMTLVLASDEGIYYSSSTTLSTLGTISSFKERQESRRHQPPQTFPCPLHSPLLHPRPISFPHPSSSSLCQTQPWSLELHHYRRMYPSASPMYVHSPSICGFPLNLLDHNAGTRSMCTDPERGRGGNEGMGGMIRSRGGGDRM